ncbi:MAG: ABC transporter ATP-binding protein [Bacteroidales bacterium]|nr:ABC transporter ATP-binding protein [Bacteroidales bacterium]
MIKVLLRYVKQYKKSAILTPVFTGLVVLMETLVTFVTASIVDKGIIAGNMAAVVGYGALMIAMALLGLYFGIQSGRYAAYSSSGFGANLREAMYANIQKFSFKDIDKFSTPSLVTRMTTDVSNIQNAFQMLMRISTRAPLTIIFSMFMCFAINPKVSLIFLVAIVILTVSLYFIVSRSMKLFAEMMRKYDDLNALVRENVAGIRVVKSFVRENHESLKFRLAVDLIYKLSVRAEVMMNLNGPVMNLVTYGSMIALSWFGATFIVSGELTTGQLTSLFSYVMAILVSLMMLSMVVVFLTMSIASARRVAEVISHNPSMHQDDDPVLEVRNGGISFEDVVF